MDRCSSCARLLPRRPGTLSMLVAHVCTDFQGKPMPYGVDLAEVGPLTKAGIIEGTADWREQLEAIA